MDFKILLINPPFNHIRPTQTIPLGLLNLGTILENQGFEIKIIDLPAENPYGINFISNPPSPHEFLQGVKKFDPDIIGITSVTENYPIAMKIAQMCKEELENIKILYGGIHATFQAVECLTENECIDIITIGETEHVIGDIVIELGKQNDLNHVNNIAFIKNGVLRINKCTLPDLKAIPQPDLSLIKDKYYPSFSQQIEFSRGCPFDCAFCCLSPNSERQVRYFPASRVVDSLESYRELFGNFSFSFTDPTFLMNYKKVNYFLDELKKRNVELNEWNFKTRADTINREILSKLKLSNARAVFLGIEDIHNSVLRKINKRQVFSQVKKVLKMLKELDLISYGNFIIGLPSQTKKHVFENISAASNLDHFTFLCLTPLPGSKIYNSPEKYGLSILTKDWELYTFRDILTNSITFPTEEQKKIRDICWNYMAENYLEKESTAFFDRKEYERLLELGFEVWYADWKKRHSSGWN